MAEPTVINDRYELQAVPLAKGGMGEVWAGRDTKLEREIAVKFVRFPDAEPDEELVSRFHRESRVTARLRHPGVPSIFDVGAHGDRPYLVMERVHGISVSDLIAEHGTLPLGWAAAIAAQTCSVLTAAHQEQLVHRDLKPSNLMLQPDGTVKVLDFGLAVVLDVADMSRLTRTGQHIGTPAYMAPEQIQDATSSTRSDLYSLGCVLYEALTGMRLFRGPTDYAVMNKQVGQPPVPALEHRPDIPGELDELLSELLAKEPEERPDSAYTVYRRLLPFTRDLEALPGALAAPDIPSPTRMYASVLSRVSPFDDPGRAGSDAPAHGGAADRATDGTETEIPHEGTPAQPELPEACEQSTSADSGGGRDGRNSLTRDELETAKNRADSYVQRSRYDEAAELLRSTVDSASRAFGSTDGEVIELRLEWARVLYDGSHYQRAGPVYHALATDLAQRDGIDTELVLHCRLRNASCHALGGNYSHALRAMNSLLADEQRVFGDDHPRTLDLRRQIGMLQFGAGRSEEAEATLSALLDDLLRTHDPEHSTVVKVRELLDGLPSGGG
ncbi:serine/threonine protein kinase [Actinopolyspora erythraea]|uniref:non-specific serine/threonine protein kinase n=1 Tax=Actinopolyspora erythraea TaxID=414996 RepID=A0A099D3C3_9ACTN|nr:serine/threonine-protein kinase [Actinopolyspora erythraea]ASU79330.1 serine/threonine protein kinase [Actinopolyspora erythraea]KGI80683.1 serine/threonine protein kinase [Actinopolyspora erythraea]